MLINPHIIGNVARNCHPLGCQQAVDHQIAAIQALPTITTPKRVLILGGSSGLGLAARLVCAFGGGASTFNVAIERPPRDGQTGSAGFYQQRHTTNRARALGLGAWDYSGDAFAPATILQVCEQLKETLGQVDLVIYSLATGRRDVGDHSYRSVLKPVGAAVEGLSVQFEPLGVIAERIEPATTAEINATTKVMGGEPWQQWIDALLAADLLAPGARTIAFSYIGPDWVAPIYRHGTIGVAKEHLHATANHLNSQLAASCGGSAYAVVCQALMTKASVFIPLLSSYLGALLVVLAQRNQDEGTLGQMIRLFSDKLGGEVRCDSDRLIRLDEWELAKEVQQAVAIRLAGLTPANAEQRLALSDLRQRFLALNGFAIAGVDYQQPLEAEFLLP